MATIALSVSLLITGAVVVWGVKMGRALESLRYEVESLRKPVTATIRVVDPGDPNDCIEITVTAEPGTPKEEAQSLRDKIEAAYAEFGRCPA